MADQDDDRIDQFIDRTGVTSDKDYILGALNEVLAKIKEVDKVKLSLFGTTKLSDTTKELSAVSRALADLQKAQKGVTDEAIKQEKLAQQKIKTDTTNLQNQRQALALAQQQAKAAQQGSSSGKPASGPFEQLKKDADAAFKAFADLRLQTGQNTQATDQLLQKYVQLRQAIVNIEQSKTSGKGQDINGTIQKIRQLTAVANGLEQRLGQVGSTQIGRNSQEFAQIAKDIDKADREVMQLLASLKKVSPQLAQIEAQMSRGSKGGATKKFDADLKAGEQLNSLYKGLTQQLTLLQKEAQELASKEFLGIISEDEIARLGALRGQISQLSSGIDTIDQSIGRAADGQKSYARQLFSLQQILRETPSAAFGFSTFIAAISNNIPIFVDDLQAIKKENRELAASGKPVQSTFSAIMSSLLNVQTLVLAVVSVFAIFSKEIILFVGNLFRSKEAINANFRATEEYAKGLKALSAASADATKAFQKLFDVRNRSNEAGLRALRDELKLIEASGVAAEKTFAIKEKINRLERESAGEQAKATVDDVARQLSEPSKFGLQANREELAATNKKRLFDERQLAEQKKFLATKGKLSPEDIANNLNIQSREEKIREGKAREELLKAQIANDEKSLAVAKQYTERKALIDRTYAAGRITLEEKTAYELENTQATLARANEVSAEKTAIANRRVIDNKIVLENATIDALKRNNDPSKNDKVKTSQLLLDSAKETATSAEGLNKQVVEAQTGVIDADIKGKEEALEKAKIISDENRKLTLAQAEAEVQIIQAKNDYILADETASYEAKRAALVENSNALKAVALAEERDVRNDIGASSADKAAAQKKLNAQLYSIEKEGNRSLIELEYEYLGRKTAAATAQMKAEKEIQLRLNQEISSELENELEVRLAAEQKAAAIRKERLQRELSDELTLSGFNQAEVDRFEKTGEFEIKGKRKTYEELKALFVKYNADVLGLSIDSSDKQFQIFAQEIQKRKQLYGELKDKADSINGEDTFRSTRTFMEETDANRRLYEEKKRTLKEYSAEQKKINDRAFDEEIANGKKLVAAQLENLGDVDQNLRNAEARLRQAREVNADAVGADAVKKANDELNLAKKLYEEALEYYNKRNELLGKDQDFDQRNKENDVNEEITAIELRQKAFEDYMNLVSELMDLQDSIASANFDRKMSRLDEELEALEKKNERERQMIEEGIGTEEEKEKRLGELRVKEQAARENIEKRRNKLEYDKAKAEKIAAIAAIAIGLIKAIAAIKFQEAILKANPATRALAAPFASAQIPIAFGTAAIGLAAVAATPLPKYADGTMDHPGGLAWLGDGGRSELVVEPGGKMWKTTATAQVHDLPKHSMVFPDADLAMQFARNVTDTAVGQSPSYDALQKTMRDGFNQVTKTIKNQPVPILNRDINRDMLLRYGKDYYKYL